MATKVAHFEADGTTPRHPGVEEKYGARWPANVSSVHYVVTTRAHAARWFGETGVTSTRRVIVVELLGHFAVETTRPSNNVEHGTDELVEATYSIGHVTDFSLSRHALHLTHGRVIFRRS